jgi:hypothetical protein
MIKSIENYFHNHFGFNAELKLVPKPMLAKLPIYLREAYHFYTGAIINHEFLFVFKVEEDENTIRQYKVQSDIIENALKLPVVYAFEHIAAYNRKRLIEKRVAFVVPGKQLFVPMLFLDFNEYKKIQKEQKEKVFPAAQCLFIYGMLNKSIDDMNFQQIAEKLKYGKMTITRAASNLLSLNLCDIKGTKNKKLVIERSMDNWLNALPLLINPIEKELSIEEKIENSEIFISGNKALSHYTNLNDAPPIHYAVGRTLFEKLKKDAKLNTHDGKESEHYIQIWKYDPGLLTATNFVDPLSLYLTTKNDNDERVESEYKKLIGKLW